MNDRERSGYRAKRSGFVFQSYNLLPILSAVENVEMPLLIAGVHLEGGPRAQRQDPGASSGWATGSTTVPRSCPGASSNASRSRGRSSAVPPSSGRTSRRETSTRRGRSQVTSLLRQLNHDYHQTIVVVTHDAEVAARLRPHAPDERRAFRRLTSVSGHGHVPSSCRSLGLLGVVLGITALLAATHRLTFRIAMRNVRRGGRRTVLVLLGLLVGTTIISAASSSATPSTRSTSRAPTSPTRGRRGDLQPVGRVGDYHSSRCTTYLSVAHAVLGVMGSLRSRR